MNIILVIFSLLSLFFQSINSLEVTSIPPLINVPTYSLATRNSDGKTGMNILTYATPISIRPDRMWSIGLFKGTVAHENFKNEGKGILQLLKPSHAKVVPILGGKSGRDIDKRAECERLGHTWMKPSEIPFKEEDHDACPELLPDCACYLKLELVGDLIDCGSHDLALCKVESILVNNGEEEPDTNYLDTASLRDMGIITKQGRVAEDFLST